MKPRPYVRFTSTATAGSLLTLGVNTPTRASSEAPGHEGRLANDGDVATFWQATDAGANAWLRIDLERVATLSSVKLTFPSEGVWGYRIDISEDGESGWQLVSDQSQSASNAAVRTLSAAPGVRGRFLRVTFTGTPQARPAALTELEARGNL